MASMVAVCAREIVANFLMGIGPVARLRVRAGRTSVAANASDLRRYAFGLILDNPAIQPLIPGAHVLEIGPGDHLATGLSLLAYGAASYTALDRFPGAYASPAAQEWYALVREQWSQFFPKKEWPSYLENFPAIPEVRVLRAAIETVRPSEQFDLVLSQAVGEHVTSIDAFAQATAHFLRPGGAALHNIDFSCHGFFPEEPLRFLNVPPRLWHLMGSHRGLPNRKRLHEFEEAFHRADLAVRVIAKSMTTASVPPGIADSESVRTKWASILLTK